ncbi:hypothetical protein ILYODFUR_027844 [Ilyodon furcidens]|uniref:Uncharacterized protein n=1 Tax=Ilyodon furcidens TaxID=33524 RepID=A0ABV0TND2_9TELE
MLVPIPFVTVRKPREERRSGIRWHQRHDRTDYITLSQGPELHNMASEKQMRAGFTFYLKSIHADKDTEEKMVSPQIKTQCAIMQQQLIYIFFSLMLHFQIQMLHIT